MKTTLKTLAAALVMVPALAFAADSSTSVRTTYDTRADHQYMQRSSSDMDIASDEVAVDSMSNTGTIRTETVTTTVRKQRNARSDTEYGANTPSPGETDTRVYVRERVQFERNAE